MGSPYEDRMRVSTPEGIDLDLSLAGLGSRVAAAVIDGAILVIATFVLMYLSFRVATDLGAGGWAFAVLTTLVFGLWFGYDVAFETLNSGRTPGKIANGLRVLRTDGRPVTFRTSAVRNILRLVDGPVTLFIAGTVAILASPRNQRLGDLAAGTIVVRERRQQAAPALAGQDLFPLPTAVASWDASAVTTDELGAVRSFLERRHGLEAVHRERIAMELATRLGTKVVGATGRMHPEAFLEGIRAAKSRVR